MNKDRTLEKMKSMSDEDLAWIESTAQQVRFSRVQKVRNYTLHEDKRAYQPRPRKRESIELLGSDASALAAASLHTFFRDSYSKHHPGHTPEEDAWEQDY